MELLYIWLGEIKDRSRFFVFENQGFKLTSEFDIVFDKDKNELSIKKNNNYCADFYKVNSNFKAPFNLTCIVGENGAGKTSLLEMIKKLLLPSKPHLVDDFLNDYNKYLIVWRTEKDLIKYYQFKLNIKQPTLDNYIFLPSTFKDFNSDKIKNNVLYYDNTFDKFEINARKNMGEYDISSKYLYIKPDYEKIDCYIHSKEKFLSYRRDEFNKIIKFYFEDTIFKNLSKRLIRFNLPRSLFKITPRNCRFDPLLNHFSKNELFSNYIRETYCYIESKLKSNINFENKLKWYFARTYLFVCLFYIYEQIKNNISEITTFNTSIIKKYKINKKCSSVNFIDNALGYILEIFKTSSSMFLKNDIFNFIEYLKLYNKQLYKCLNYLLNYSVHNERDGYEIIININSIDESNKDKVKKQISSLLDIYIKLQILLEGDCGEFLHLSFHPRFSTGEYSLITIFSRIFYLFNHNNDFKDAIKNNGNLFFLIDEAELGFHPQWCKEYVEILISYLQELFAEYNIPIHLIITTNNPIVLSDILSDDVIYLKNKETLNSDKQPKIAFCSNILDLYSDSFFIQDGLIGAFAKKKINQVIKFIKYNKQNKQEISDEKRNERIISREECEFIIENIGDSNIKGFLRGLFEDLKRKERL